MLGLWRGQGAIWRGGGLMLAALAFAVRLAAPSGWMLQTADSGALQMVVCTGHMLAHHSAPTAPGHAPKSDDDRPCAFAGFATPTPPAAVISLAAPVAYETYAAPERRLADLSPGRGLAAPPPPSQGPPVLSI